MKKIILLQIFFLTLITVSCEKEEDNITLTLEKVHGYVQKGPYLNGTAINISELSEDLIPTGRNFTSQILDNKGTFEIKNVKLSSVYIELKADGFYFNEIKNENSNAQLTLFALSDLSDKSSLNVNVLSNLEKGRVEYLTSNGSTFNDAKSQAQSEILKIFEIEKSDMTESENLDITQEGDDNAILLAVSVILQGHLYVAELSELLANISTDIREDGVLNSQSLGVSLINNANIIKTNEIRSNLKNRYESLGLEVTIPDFEKYVKQFIDSTDYIANNYITYPLTYDSRINILIDSSFIVQPGIVYSIAAYLPVGRTIKIHCKPSDGYDWGALGFFGSDLVGFTFHNYMPDSVLLSAEGLGETVNCPAMFGESAPVSATSIDFFIYEDDSTVPTRIKTVRTF